MKVAVIMGSTSDLEVMSGAFGILEDFGIEFEKRVISAHRTPELMFEYTKGLKDRGFGVVIAGAGGAAHLAGVAAGLTTLPVIAVPMATKNLGGLYRYTPVKDFVLHIRDERLYEGLAKTQYVDDSKVTDHYAIIPTGDISRLASMSDLQKSVYDMIVRRFLSVFYPSIFFFFHIFFNRRIIFGKGINS